MRERLNISTSPRLALYMEMCVCVCECVYVSVCVRARERKREREGVKIKEKIINSTNKPRFDEWQERDEREGERERKRDYFERRESDFPKSPGMKLLQSLVLSIRPEKAKSVQKKKEREKKREEAEGD